MKKLVAIILTVVMVFSMATVAFADTTVNGDSGTVVVKYTTSEAYTVTIPADVTLTSTKLSDTGNVTVSDALLASGETLKIAVESANNYKLVNSTSGIAYTLKSGDTAITVDNNVVLSVAAGTKSGSAELTFATTEEDVKAATIAGDHKDTLTFTVSVAVAK